MRLDCLAPFPLRSATLPLTGDRHPLRREYTKWMSWGNAGTLLASLLVTGMFLSLQKPSVIPPPIYRVIICGPLPEPSAPRIEVTSGPKTPVGPQPKLGIIEPTANLDPSILDFPNMNAIPGTGDLGDILPSNGEEWVVNPPLEDALPGPDVFVAVEVLPEQLRMDSPIYPPLARELGIEGTVMLRILVSKEGRVLDCIVMSGNPMLVDAAIVAARTAVFSPALQQQKPVAVWVQLPIVFSLK